MRNHDNLTQRFSSTLPLLFTLTLLLNGKIQILSLKSLSIVNIPTMYWSLVLIFSIMGCEIIFCITLNLLFTVIILKSKTLRKSFTNIIFALMFVAHFLTNVCNIGKFCARFLTDTRYIDVISNSRDFFSGLVVGFSTLLSLVTFLSIYKPFVYEKFTTKHAVVAITTIFLIMI